MEIGVLNPDVDLNVEMTNNQVANIITDWLMGRFKGRAEKLRIERQEVEFEAGAMKRIVLETITRETDR